MTKIRIWRVIPWKCLFCPEILSTINNFQGIIFVISSRQRVNINISGRDVVRDKRDPSLGQTGTRPWDKPGPVPGTNRPFSVEFHSKIAILSHLSLGRVLVCPWDVCPARAIRKMFMCFRDFQEALETTTATKRHKIWRKICSKCAVSNLSFHGRCISRSLHDSAKVVISRLLTRNCCSLAVVVSATFASQYLSRDFFQTFFRPGDFFQTFWGFRARRPERLL